MNKSSGQYDPKQYWERRLSANFDLRGVGHISFGQGYNKWLYRRKRAVIERFFGGTPLSGKHVLDIGCGTGFFVAYYLSKGAHVFGLDITEVSVKQLQARYPGTFLTQDIGSTTYRPPRKFDIVNVWDVLYHVTDDDAFEVAIGNIASSIVPGGLLLLDDYLADPEDTRIGGHVKGRNLATYRRALARLGFKLIQTAPLYRMLDRGHFGRYDNYLAPVYFALDMRTTRMEPGNICFSGWRYEPDSAA